MGALKRGLTLQWKSDATIPATFWEIRRKLSVRRTYVLTLAEALT